MPGIGDLSESIYVQKEDIGDGRTVTITGYERKNVAKQHEKPSMKYVLEFQNCKPLCLNVTNGKTIAKIMSQVYGLSLKPEKDGQNSDGSTRWIPQCEKFDNWIDKQIILWFNPDIEYAGEVTGGIRVRPPKLDTKAGLTEPQQEQYSQSAEEQPPANEDTTDYGNEEPPF